MPHKGSTEQLDGSMHDAAESGDAKTFNALMRKGSDRYAPDASGWTPVHLAARNGHSEIVRAALAQVLPGLRGPNDLTALHLAAWEGHQEVVRVLLENEASVNAVDANGATPLFLASEHGHTEVVRLLLDAGADANLTEHTWGQAPLQLASRRGHLEVVQLLAVKANVNAMDRDWGDSALHEAAIRNHADVVLTLLDPAMPRYRLVYTRRKVAVPIVLGSVSN